MAAMDSPLNPLDMRADPDAQATVTDFLDFTEYLPSDMMRSLTLIGKLDQTYIDASARVHDLTTTWGQLPTLAPADRNAPVELRAHISQNLNHAVNARIYSHAEAVRMNENVSRHYNRAKTILTKLETMLDTYPTAEEQKSPVATAKSPQVAGGHKLPLRIDGQKVRRQRVPRITVPGEVLAPYELNYDAFTSGSDSSSSDEESDPLPSRRITPAPQARIKVVKSASRPSARPITGKTPKPRPSALAGGSGTPVISTSAALAQLQPPPENAVIGSPDAPWGQLTPFELAALRKRMKKNSNWAPSDTMVARELKMLGRGVDAYRAAKQKAEDEGKPFEGQMPIPVLDPETGTQRMPLGALTFDALASDEKSLSNRGMKLNEAKKLKRETLARLAAEEAEESARKLEVIARTLMSDAPQPPVQEPASKAASKARPPKKRKRDSVAELDAEKPDQADGLSQKPPFKRTKTETPVPPPHLASGNSQLPHETPVQPPQRMLPVLHSTTPIPLPVHAQDQSITAKSGTSVASTTSPAPSSVAGPTSASVTIPPVKLPGTETPIPPPIHSPKKSTTPILPPVRETRKTQAARMHEQHQQHKDKDKEPPATLQPSKPPSRNVSPAPLTPTPEPDAAQAAISAPTSATSTVTMTNIRRPVSRSGKANSQEPQPSLAADRPRRASTARNTPAPERAEPAAAATATAATATVAAAVAVGAAGAARPNSRRSKRPAPGVISRTISGGNSAVGKRKAAPKKKAARGSMGSSSKPSAANVKDSKGGLATSTAAGGEGAAGGGGGGVGGVGESFEVEVDDEGTVVDPDEPRYCLCNRVSYGTMIQCDNVDVSCIPSLFCLGILFSVGLVCCWSSASLVGCAVYKSGRDHWSTSAHRDAPYQAWDRHADYNGQNCKQEWFHLECVDLKAIPARTTKWYCPDCRKLLNIGEKGEVSARGVKA